MERVSKTQKKIRALAVQELGHKLTELRADQLDTIPLPVELRKEIELAQKISKHGGLKRQEQYIGALMRKIDCEPIEQAVSALQSGKRRQIVLHHQIETWRDQLLSGNEDPIMDHFASVSESDRRQLRDLAQKARTEKSKERPSPAPARALFRLLLTLASREHRERI